MPKKTPDQWSEEYGQSHQNPTNKLFHWFCVPAITTSLLGLLWSIPTPHFSDQVPLWSEERFRVVPWTMEQLKPLIESPRQYQYPN